MLFPKYNAKQIEQYNQVIQQVASKFPRISMSLLWLYPYYKSTDYDGEHPTQTEFGCFCLQNNIDISKVKLYDELEVNNQLLMFAKSVGIPEDILESWRL